LRHNPKAANKFALLGNKLAKEKSEGMNQNHLAAQTAAESSSYLAVTEGINRQEGILHGAISESKN
jgi:hypothetical protein